MFKFYISTLILFSVGISKGQQQINTLILENLKSRFYNVEIVSVQPDSCPDLSKLFLLSNEIKVTAAECEMKISRAFYMLSANEISRWNCDSLCKVELNKMETLSKLWNQTLTTNAESCVSVRYLVNHASTELSYYSRDLSKYKQGYTPYLREEFNSTYCYSYLNNLKKSYEFKSSQVR